jgi:hypothetical protein
MMRGNALPGRSPIDDDGFNIPRSQGRGNMGTDGRTVSAVEDVAEVTSLR